MRSITDNNIIIDLSVVDVGSIDLDQPPYGHFLWRQHYWNVKPSHYSKPSPHLQVESPFESHDLTYCHMQCKMATTWTFLLTSFILSLFIPSVSAFDGGDIAALILGLFIGTLAICACIGVYARKRGG